MPPGSGEVMLVGPRPEERPETRDATCGAPEGAPAGNTAGGVPSKRCPSLFAPDRRSPPSCLRGKEMKAAPRALLLPGPMNHACVHDADVMRGLFDN